MCKRDVMKNFTLLFSQNDITFTKNLIMAHTQNIHLPSQNVCRKDVRLPIQLQRAMAAEAEAAREARAKVIFSLSMLFVSFTIFIGDCS